MSTWHAVKPPQLAKKERIPAIMVFSQIEQLQRRRRARRRGGFIAITPLSSANFSNPGEVGGLRTEKTSYTSEHDAAWEGHEPQARY